LTPEWMVQVQRWSPVASRWNFLQPQTSRDCYEHRLNWSVWHETTNISLRSRKDCQWLRICWVTLCCEGMTATSTLESEISSHTKESSKRRLTCRSERGDPPRYWETSSWEHSLVLAPTLTCEGYSGCHEVEEAGVMTMRMSPEDHPLTTTTTDVPGGKPQDRSRSVM
jgi:hypothetical protein